MRSLATRFYIKLFSLAFYPRCRNRRIHFEAPLPAGGSIFIANHLVTRGPIYVTCYFPVPVRPWIGAYQSDPERFVDSVSERYLEAVLHIPSPLSRLVARLCFATMWGPFVRGQHPIPIDKYVQQTAVRASVALLQAGDSLLVFPERVHRTDRVSSFYKGAARLIQEFHRTVGTAPNVIPLAVDQSANMRVGPRIALGGSTIDDPDACTRVLEDALSGVFSRLTASRREA